MTRPSVRCLVLSRYGLRGASSRVRFAQYFSALHLDGIECHFSPLLSDAYLLRRYARNPLRYLDALLGYVVRLREILLAHRFDVVWIEGELFPNLPTAFEEMVLRCGVPYVLDYDDAIFIRYEKFENSCFKTLYEKKFDLLLSGAAAVTVGNRFLESWARKGGAQTVIYVPTVIDGDRYFSHVGSQKEGDELLLGWIGSPHTTIYLDIVKAALERLNRKVPIRLITIGANALENYSVPIRQHEWSLEQELALLDSIDIGIMPLVNDAWSRGKCGYKLIQYMAMGKPVVASAVGANLDIVTHGVNGFLVNNEDDWMQSLGALIGSSELRVELGKKGKEHVKTHFTTQIMAPFISKTLREAAGGNQ